MTLLTKERVLDALDAGRHIKLEDCFVFHDNTDVVIEEDPMTRMPKMSVSKRPIAMRPDMILSQTPRYISLAGAAVDFLDNLTKSDARAYQEQIQQAVRMSHDWDKQRLASQAGIITPGAGVPKGVRG